MYICIVEKIKIVMSKILDAEFRKELYKNLVDAGYEKKEAQKIVGIKYNEELKFAIDSMLSSIASEVRADNFDIYDSLEETFKNISSMVLEGKKLKEAIG